MHVIGVMAVALSGVLALATPPGAVPNDSDTSASGPAAGVSVVGALPAGGSAAEAPAWLDALRDRRVVVGEDLSKARAALDAASAASPGDARLVLGRALVERASGALASAKELGDRAASMAPDDGEIAAWQGTFILEAIGASSAGVFSKADEAQRGKGAYERALTLDPGSLDAHIGLAMYAIKAPALFGGSIREARARAATLMTLPGGESYARIVLGQIAAYKDDRRAMDAEFARAVEADPPPHRRLIALNAWAFATLQDIGDAPAAEALFRRCIELAPGVSAYWFGLGESLRKQRKWGEAAQAYREALRLQPGASASARGLKQCEARLRR